MALPPNTPPANSDAQAGVPGETPTASLARAKQRAAAFYAAKAQADVNAGAALPVVGPDGRRRYETRPVPTKRLFGSPLSTRAAANYVVVVSGVAMRRVTSGWSDVRSVGYDANVDTNRRHSGLDFAAPVGEPVYAAADGVVAFVGVQRRLGGRFSLLNPKVDSEGNVAGTTIPEGNAVTVSVKELGHGGLYVQIAHNGDFQGYKTAYMHLSEALNIKKGDKVLEGDLIGRVGRTGGTAGITSGPHLHWQVAYGAGDVPVKPEPLVLHYNPRNPSDAPGGNILADTLTQLAKTGKVSMGEMVVVTSFAADIAAMNRAVDSENKTRADILRRQADHSNFVAASLNVEAGQAHQATAQFQASQPIVQNPMTFDYATGLWSDGKMV